MLQLFRMPFKVRLIFFSLLLLLSFGLQKSAIAASCALASIKSQPCSEKHLSTGDQFLLAVARGQLHKAKQLLAGRGVTVDYRSSNAYIVSKTRVRADIDSPFMAGNKRYQFASGTAFDIALSQYNHTMVKWLLSRGASPDAGYFANLINRTHFVSQYPNSYLQLPYTQRAKIIAVGYVMELAARRNDVVAVQKLLSIEPRAIHYRGNIILSKAIQQGKWRITNLILDRGRDVHHLNNFSGLFESTIRSEPTQYRLLQKLLRHAKQRKKFNYTGLIDEAIANNDEKALRLLVASGANLNPKRGQPPLYKVLDTDNLRTARTLFSLGANPNLIYSNESLLQRAIRHEKLAFVKLLLEHKAKPNESKNRRGSSNLEIAMSKKDLRYSSLLIAAGANVNKVTSGSTALIRAVEQVRPKLVSLLIKARANLKATNYAQETALHIATRKADKGLMQLLLKAGANPNARNQSRQTPLLIAISHKNLALIQILLPYKANINLANDSGQTPLHSAVLAQNLPIVQFLLAKGAIPNTNARYGSTPLLDALSWRRPQIARLLINKGANVNVVSNARESALDIANKRGLRALAHLIRQKGGLTATQLGANPEHVRVRSIQ